MTVAQIAWLNANTQYTPVCQAAFGWGYVALQSIDVNGNALPGCTIQLPPVGPLSGDENVSSICVGRLVKLGT